MRARLPAASRERLASGQRRLLDELLGDPSLDADQIRMLQHTIRDCGAVDEIEAVISANTEEAIEALESRELDRGAARDLADLARAVTRRES
jgi:geranylgeranyl diphosphate synthase type I